MSYIVEVKASFDTLTDAVDFARMNGTINESKASETNILYVDESGASRILSAEEVDEQVENEKPKEATE